MENNIEALRSLPIPANYLEELKKAYYQKDPDAFRRTFSKIAKELEKAIRNYKDNNIYEGNPIAYTQFVPGQKIVYLEAEYENNLVLFQIASIFQYQEGMAMQFDKMVRNREDIRQENNRGTFKSDKISYLETEFEDNLALFQIASLFQYQEGMAKQFDKMDQNCRDIRREKRDSFKSKKNTWSNPETYALSVQYEKTFALEMELADLRKLHSIATSAGYTEGAESVFIRIQKINSSIETPSELGQAPISFVRK